MVKLRFRIPAAQARSEARTVFEGIRRQYYQRLWERRIPGAAWFRHQMRASSGGDGSVTEFRPGFAGPMGGPGTDLERGFSLFSGGWAMSENLQLDRACRGLG